MARSTIRTRVGRTGGETWRRGTTRTMEGSVGKPSVPMARNAVHRRPSHWNACKKSIRWTTKLQAMDSKQEEDPEARRMRESAVVEEKTRPIYGSEDFRKELEAAGDNKLVVLEVMSESVCDLGLDEPEPEVHWEADKPTEEEIQAPCVQLKHVFQRCARDCPDVVFLSLEGDATEESKALCEELGIATFPTLQFYRSGELLWQHAGAADAGMDLGQGVLYYGNRAGDGVVASDFVKEIQGKEELERFVQEQDKDVLTVVDVSLTNAEPCIRIYPAVLALAKNFTGMAVFGRLMGDASKEHEELMRELNILEVPTFLFYRNGRSVGRHVGSSRGDLIGQILMQQGSAGLPVPPPSSRGTRSSAASPKQQKRRSGQAMWK